MLHQPNSSTTDIWTLIIHNALSFKIHCRKPLKSSKDSGLKCNLSYAKENQIHFAFNEKTNILHAVLHPPVIVRLGSKCAYIPSSSSVPILQTGSSSGELLTGTIKSWQLRRIRVLSLMRQSGPLSSHAGRYLRTMKWQPLAFSESPTISVHWGVFCWLWKVFYFSGAMIRRFNRMLSSRRECCRRRRRRHWQNGAINAGFPIRADCGEKWYIIGFECHSPPNEGLKIQLI